MKNVRVLGMGCPSCKRTVALIEQVAADLDVAVIVEKVEDLPEIMSYGIVGTPGVVIDGTVVHAGGVPSQQRIREWLAA